MGPADKNCADKQYLLEFGTTNMVFFIFWERSWIIKSYLQTHVGMSSGKFKSIAGKHWEVQLM